MPNLGYMAVQSFHLLALSLWIGGTVALSVLAAPSVFRLAPDPPSAARVMAEIFQKFDRVKGMCCLALVVTSILKYVNWERNWNVWFALRYSAILVMILAAFVDGWMVAPSLRQLRSSSPTHGGAVTTAESGTHLPPAQVDRFRQLHRASVRLSQAGLVAALVALILA